MTRKSRVVSASMVGTLSSIKITNVLFRINSIPSSTRCFCEIIESRECARVLVWTYGFRIELERFFLLPTPDDFTFEFNGLSHPCLQLIINILLKHMDDYLLRG